MDLELKFITMGFVAELMKQLAGRHEVKHPQLRVS
jgi:hypothetical protein